MMRLSVISALAFITLALPAPSLAGSDPHAGHKGHVAAGGDDPHAAHRAAMAQGNFRLSVANYDIPDVTLLNSRGEAVDLQGLLQSDKPVVLNFIFTTCTTICPVMTATFSQMRRSLQDDADRVDLISISIDPDYDRPDVLDAYSKRFHATQGWSFLTGDSRDIERILRSFDTFAGSKLNHRAATFLKHPGSSEWIRIDGLASGERLAREVRDRML